MHYRYKFFCENLKDKVDLSNAVIVDCACGFGQGTKTLLPYNVQNYIGIDINKDFLKRCTDHYKDDTRVTFFQGNICSLNFENTADIFICSETLEHLFEHETEKAINNIKRATKNNGYICITVPRSEKECLRDINHKQFLNEKNLKNYFKNFEVINEGVLYKKEKDGGNYAIILRNKK